MRERRKNEKPEYEEIRGMITKIISKYKRILRTKDEMEDLQQDAFLIYCEKSEYLEKKYGSEIRNFNTMLYNAIAWEINRYVDRKYLLIKKSFTTNRENIYSTDVDPSILLDIEYEDYLIKKIEDSDKKSNILYGLNDIERYVVIRNFGLDGDVSFSLAKIADILNVSYYKVCITKKQALNKIKKNIRKKGGNVC